MNKEELMLRKHLVDLSNKAYQRNIVAFSDFLNLNELHILHTTPKGMFPSKYKAFGGYDLSERQMIAFLPDALYYTLAPADNYLSSSEADYALPSGWEYPIQAVSVQPLNSKFAEELSHRDYLGSLMNLGIERSKFGDIIVKDKEAIIFLCEEISDYVIDNLSRIRHTSVRCARREVRDIAYTPAFVKINGTVPSIRLDTVMSVAFPASRSKLTAYIAAGRVFVNGKLIASNGYRLEEGDLISVRGLGRISYDCILSETKKGRYLISVKKYI